MDRDTADEGVRSSVNSLKSRFEQLAAREIKNGPDDKQQALGLRPASTSTEEIKSRISSEGTLLFISPAHFS
jgi:hypothetical protein